MYWHTYDSYDMSPVTTFTIPYLIYTTTLLSILSMKPLLRGNVSASFRRPDSVLAAELELNGGKNNHLTGISLQNEAKPQNSVSNFLLLHHLV